MPVIVLDVPMPAWNETVIQSVLHGLDICPDYHREKGNTVVEITGTWQKLNTTLTRIKAKQPGVELLGVMETKENDQCR
jgi:hypothetical protein